MDKCDEDKKKKVIKNPIFYEYCKFTVCSSWFVERYHQCLCGFSKVWLFLRGEMIKKVKILFPLFFFFENLVCLAELEITLKYCLSLDTCWIQLLTASHQLLFKPCLSLCLERRFYLWFLLHRRSPHQRHL